MKLQAFQALFWAINTNKNVMEAMKNQNPTIEKDYICQDFTQQKALQERLCEVTALIREWAQQCVSPCCKLYIHTSINQGAHTVRYALLGFWELIFSQFFPRIIYLYTNS